MKLPTQASPVSRQASHAKYDAEGVAASGIACTLCQMACNQLSGTAKDLCLLACNNTVC